MQCEEFIPSIESVERLACALVHKSHNWDANPLIILDSILGVQLQVLLLLFRRACSYLSIHVHNDAANKFQENVEYSTTIQSIFHALHLSLTLPPSK